MAEPNAAVDPKAAAGGAPGAVADPQPEPVAPEPEPQPEPEPEPVEPTEPEPEPEGGEPEPEPQEPEPQQQVDPRVLAAARDHLHLMQHDPVYRQAYDQAYQRAMQRGGGQREPSLLEMSEEQVSVRYRRLKEEGKDFEAQRLVSQWETARAQHFASERNAEAEQNRRINAELDAMERKYGQTDKALWKQMQDLAGTSFNIRNGSMEDLRALACLKLNRDPRAVPQRKGNGAALVNSEGNRASAKAKTGNVTRKAPETKTDSPYPEGVFEGMLERARKRKMLTGEVVETQTDKG